MKAQEEALIRRMQDNLATIRKVGGWTAAQFGDEIGVTRQTVSNLEKGKTPLTKTQYLAIRAVLIHEIGSKGNEGLAQVVRALVDEPIEEEMGETVEIQGPRPTASVMEDMTRTTELLARGLTSVLAELPSSLPTTMLTTTANTMLTLAAMDTVPAIIYALTNKLGDYKPSGKNPNGFKE